jgi:hypothetical protein
MTVGWPEGAEDVAASSSSSPRPSAAISRLAFNVKETCRSLANRRTRFNTRADHFDTSYAYLTVRRIMHVVNSLSSLRGVTSAEAAPTTGLRLVLDPARWAGAAWPVPLAPGWPCVAGF